MARTKRCTLRHTAGLSGRIQEWTKRMPFWGVRLPFCRFPVFAVGCLASPDWPREVGGALTPPPLQNVRLPRFHEIRPLVAGVVAFFQRRSLAVTCGRVEAAFKRRARPLQPRHGYPTKPLSEGAARARAAATGAGEHLQPGTRLTRPALPIPQSSKPLVGRRACPIGFLAQPPLGTVRGTRAHAVALHERTTRPAAAATAPAGPVPPTRRFEGFVYFHFFVVRAAGHVGPDPWRPNTPPIPALATCALRRGALAARRLFRDLTKLASASSSLAGMCRLAGLGVAAAEHMYTAGMALNRQRLKAPLAASRRVRQAQSLRSVGYSRTLRAHRVGCVSRIRGRVLRSPGRRRMHPSPGTPTTVRPRSSPQPFSLTYARPELTDSGEPPPPPLSFPSGVPGGLRAHRAPRAARQLRPRRHIHLRRQCHREWRREPR